MGTMGLVARFVRALVEICDLRAL